MKIESAKSRTVIASVLSIITAGVGVYLGDASAWQGLQASIMALIAIFMREAIARVGVTASDAAQAAHAAQESAEHAEREAARAAGQHEAVRPTITPAAGEF